MLVADKVHLVDGDDHAAHAHQGDHREVAEGLGTHTACRIDEENGDLRIGSGHRHIPRVLLVAGSIRDDDATTTGEIHVAVGHIDGDALLALGLEAVGEQGEVNLANRNHRAAATRAPRIVELVLGDGARLGQKTTDERRLAVIHRTTRDKTDDGCDVDAGGSFEQSGHQK